MTPYMDWLIHHPTVIVDYALWILVIIWGLAMRITNSGWYTRRLSRKASER